MSTKTNVVRLPRIASLSWDDCRLLVESVADYAIFMLDVDGRVATWNLGAERIKGYRADEIIGEHFSRFFPLEDIAANKPERELETAMAAGRTEDEGWRVRKDGSRFWANVVITALRDEGGDLRGFAKVTRDLTERRRADETARDLLREQLLYAAERSARERLELLARASDVLSSAFEYDDMLQKIVAVALPRLADFAFFDVVESDGVRRVAAAHDDPELEAILKRTRWVRSERTDKNLCALSTGETAFHPAIDDAWRVDAALSPDHLALLRRLALGSMISVPLRGRGELFGSLTLCFGKSGRHHTADDVSLAEELARRAAMAVVQARLLEQARHEAKRAEDAARRAEDANRLKDEFLATVSHELRTPLNAILGWASLARGGRSGASLEKAIEIIHRNATAQSRIVDDILDVSRIVTGKLRLSLKPTDLVATVRDAIEVVRPSAVAKHIALRFAPATERATLVGDPERLRQVAWNLLSNAVKFTDAGGEVSIALAQDGTRFVLSVRDDGRGIDPDFLPYVFDRFKQADGSTTRRFGGLGLGLAIVRHIVELHGGMVDAESAGIGKGALFRVTLPIRAVVSDEDEEAAPAGAADAPVSPREVPSLVGVRVVVVDDEPDARELVHTVLVGAGAIVETADSASSGLEAVRRFRPHVVVSDIGMPYEDGLAFVRRLRALAPSEGGGVPSIALTAYTRNEDRTKALAAGFTTHVGKPVNPADLVAAVANIAVFVRR